MLSINDGRAYFYQWDINRHIKVADATVTELHFGNTVIKIPLTIPVINGLAKVPNILLQRNFPIKVYGYCGDGYTKIEQTFNVKSRTKPTDYVYKETEVKTYSGLDEKLTELDERFTELENNCVTTDYVDEAVKELGFPTDEHINKLIDKATDGLDIPTEEQINELISEATSNLDIPTDEYITGLINDATNNLDIPTDEYINGLISEATESLDIPTNEHINGLINDATSNLDIPTDEHINGLINNALGVIENGAY